MKIFKVIAIAMLVFSASMDVQGQYSQPSPGASKSNAKKKLSWKKYHTICGKKNSKRGVNFEKVKGQNIVWHGTVIEVIEDVSLSQNRRWSPEVIRLKMDPSDSLVADVRLRIPLQEESKMKKLKAGEILGFKGKVMYLGTRISDHIIEVDKFKRLRRKQ